jgi:hypothetical protein
VIPAVIIHQVVHGMEGAMKKPFAANLPPRVKVAVPVVAALLAIIPVVPAVDHAQCSLLFMDTAILCPRMRLSNRIHACCWG